MDKGEFAAVTNKITVSGIVQGVGFRPLTFRIAKKHRICGTVQNVGGRVEIIVQAAPAAIADFLRELSQTELEGGEITDVHVEELEPGEAVKYTDFRIVESREVKSRMPSIIPPDLAVCASCQRELESREDRRYRHPFISCMSCGPRYTIIDRLPYDRDTTVMEDFVMCEACREEYTSPESRRFHAQTISCYDCGPYLMFQECSPLKDAEIRGRVNNVESAEQGHLQETEERLLQASEEEIEERLLQVSAKEAEKLREQGVLSPRHSGEGLERAAAIIKSGGILAVKGIGGYHFVCSPFFEESVQNLRSLKGREEKPFAVMFESLEQIKEYCQVSPQEAELLESKERPIVLLYSDNTKLAPSVCKQSSYCGAFLPYTPLQILLLQSCGPLIMTSANLSGQPIIHEDDTMLSLQEPLLNGVLYNKRRILRSVDDSVAKVIDGKVQIIRRSRGYVPYPVFLPESRRDLNILAAGGDLKAAVCLYRQQQAVVSQYFGDLEEQAVFEEYKRSADDLSKLLQITPDLVVCDLHPNYFSSRYAKSLEAGLKKPVLHVQHHHAHIAAVMAEHQLTEPVIGVAFDGTGYGTDGAVWGGEFLICRGAEFERAAQLKYTPLMGGDSSARDAKKTAVCFLLASGLQSFVNDTRSDIIESALNNQINTVLSSSMGRLFDAVSSILEISHENSYEGECAALLEKEALLAEQGGLLATEMSFGILHEDGGIKIDPQPVLQEICSHSISSDEQRRKLALGFHYALVDAVLAVCNHLREKSAINEVALSGGVFQNSVLTNRVLRVLREQDFKVYYNQAVPPNDGAISLGQAYIGIMKTNQEEAE